MAAHRHARTFVLTPVPENLFRDPIEYLLVGQTRLQTVCEWLDHIAADPTDPEATARAFGAVDYLASELPQHLDDETSCLLPAMRRRCRPEDQIQDVADVISQRSSAIRRTASVLADVLQRLVRGESLTHDRHGLNVILAFTAAARRRLTWTGAVLFPMAQRMLTADDLVQMGRDMASRRGAPYPE